MKIAVLIPSHISYKDQLSRLDACLESLYSQTVIPDIFLSISFANSTYKREFSTLLRKYSTIKIKLSAQQKFQMEHLYILSSYISDYDMIMFCDDDDTYLPMRVQTFADAFENLKEHCGKTGAKFGGVREVNSMEHVRGSPEYWAYGIPPSLLTQFFIRIKGYEDLMRHKFADMYLRGYLRQTGGKSMNFITVIPTEGVTMYQYTEDNPNSICGHIETEEEMTREIAITYIRDNLTLYLISDRMDLLCKHMTDTSMPMNMLSSIVPDMDRITRLTKILYV